MDLTISQAKNLLHDFGYDPLIHESDYEENELEQLKFLIKDTLRIDATAKGILLQFSTTFIGSCVGAFFGASLLGFIGAGSFLVLYGVGYSLQGRKVEPISLENQLVRDILAVFIGTLAVSVLFTSVVPAVIISPMIVGVVEYALASRYPTINIIE